MFLFAGNWCDQIFMKMIRFIFGVRISVLKAGTLTEERFDHSFPLHKADLVVLFNDRAAGHYSAIRK
jgi:hypothetical protein